MKIFIDKLFDLMTVILINDYPEKHPNEINNSL